MKDIFSRTEIVFGSVAMEKLFSARVAVFGLGGVGGHAVEALARSGVGTLDLFDSDTVCVSNLNRQIIATQSTLGMPKTEAAKKRILEINPDINVNIYNVFYLPENADMFDLSVYSYIIDAIDTVTAKLELIKRAKAANIPIISCMGTGNKVHPEMLEISDIYKTSVCPLAKVMRKELKERGIKKLDVLYSKEIPVRNGSANDEKLPEGCTRRQIPGSTSFVPAAAGLIMAAKVVRSIAGIE